MTQEAIKFPVHWVDAPCYKSFPGRANASDFLRMLLQVILSEFHEVLQRSIIAGLGCEKFPSFLVRTFLIELKEQGCQEKLGAWGIKWALCIR